MANHQKGSKEWFESKAKAREELEARISGKASGVEVTDKEEKKSKK